MWVLIAIIYVGVHVYSGAASVTIPGFKSKAACAEAAKEVSSQIKRGDVETICLATGTIKATVPPLAVTGPADDLKSKQ